MAKKTKTAVKRSGTRQAKSSSSSTSGSSRAKEDNNSTSASKSKKSEKTLEDLFEEGLKDVLSAEQQLVEALPKMARAADSEALEDAFNYHLEQTRKQLARVEKIMERLGIDNSEEKECEAMKGLVEEAQEIIDEFEAGPVRDAALIIAAQKVEHYEIASYGSLRELADVLGLERECDLLDRTLQEEGETDHTLSQLAMQINDSALETGEQYAD